MPRKSSINIVLFANNAFEVIIRTRNGIIKEIVVLLMVAEYDRNCKIPALVSNNEENQ